MNTEAGNVEIPGYNEALAHEQQARELAFIDVPRIVCGYPVRQITLNSLLLLMQAKCAFITGGVPMLADVWQFLWILHPRFVACDHEARSRFLDSLPAFDVETATKEIVAFLDDTFNDAPPHSKGSRVQEPIASFLAGWIDLFGSEYGWQREEILSLPLSVLYQLRRRIQKRKDDRAPLMSRRSMRVAGEFLRAKKRERLAQQEAASQQQQPEQ